VGTMKFGFQRSPMVAQNRNWRDGVLSNNNV
jgi:hypothetical protein